MLMQSLKQQLKLGQARNNKSESTAGQWTLLERLSSAQKVDLSLRSPLINQLIDFSGHS